MGLAIFCGVVVAVWVICFGYFLLTGGLRTKNGFIVGLQRSPKQLDDFVARVKAREARRTRRP